MLDFLLRRSRCGTADRVEDPEVRGTVRRFCGRGGDPPEPLPVRGQGGLPGWLTASIAIAADAFNNLSDAGSSVGDPRRLQDGGGARSDSEHPFGHGRDPSTSRDWRCRWPSCWSGWSWLRGSFGKILRPEAVAFSAGVGRSSWSSRSPVKLWMMLVQPDPLGSRTRLLRDAGDRRWTA